MMSESFYRRLGSGKNWNREKRKPVFWINVFLAIIALYASWIHYRSRSPRSVADRERAKSTVQTATLTNSLVERFTGQVKRNMTLSDVLSAYDLPEGLMDQLVVATKPIYNLKKLLVGNWFELERLPDGTLKQFLYEIDLVAAEDDLIPVQVLH